MGACVRDAYRRHPQYLFAKVNYANLCLQKGEVDKIPGILGLWEKAFVHGFSAASCWAQAGDFHHAIGLCHDVLAHLELPERLRPRVYAYVKALCARRAQWYADVVVQDESLG